MNWTVNVFVSAHVTLLTFKLFNDLYFFKIVDTCYSIELLYKNYENFHPFEELVKHNSNNYPSILGLLTVHVQH